MHHTHFLPPRYFEFLHDVHVGTLVLRHIRAHGGCTQSDVVDLHESLCDTRNELGICDHPDYTECFDRMQSIYDALEVALDEAAGFTPQPVAA